jgi:NADPH2:quinone reductase
MINSDALLTMRVANKRNDPMKAYVFGAGGAAITDVPKPAPKGTQVLVKVHACGLNRADLGMTKGHAHGCSARPRT